MKPLSPRAVTSAQPPHTSPTPSLLGLIPSAGALALLLLPALVLFFAGCATTLTPTQLAAKSLASTVQTVDVAMQGYATAVVLDLVKSDDQVKVKILYADYQAAVTLAETAITTAIKSGDAGSLAAATAALDASKLKLLAFLARFTNAPPQ